MQFWSPCSTLLELFGLKINSWDLRISRCFKSADDSIEPDLGDITPNSLLDDAIIPFGSCTLLFSAKFIDYELYLYPFWGLFKISFLRFLCLCAILSYALICEGTFVFSSWLINLICFLYWVVMYLICFLAKLFFDSVADSYMRSFILLLGYNLRSLNFLLSLMGITSEILP